MNQAAGFHILGEMAWRRPWGCKQRLALFALTVPQKYSETQRSNSQPNNLGI